MFRPVLNVNTKAKYPDEIQSARQDITPLERREVKKLIIPIEIDEATQKSKISVNQFIKFMNK